MSLYLLLQYATEGIGLGLRAGSIKNRFPRVAGNPAAKGVDGRVGHGCLIGGGRRRDADHPAGLHGAATALRSSQTCPLAATSAVPGTKGLG